VLLSELIERLEHAARSVDTPRSELHVLIDGGYSGYLGFEISVVNAAQTDPASDIKHMLVLTEGSPVEAVLFDADKGLQLQTAEA
jgi:hypothetical protein